MPSGRDLHRGGTRLLSLLMIVLGVVMLSVTIARGVSGVSYGLIVGPLFVAAGAARLYLLSRG